MRERWNGLNHTFKKRTIEEEKDEQLNLYKKWLPFLKRDRMKIYYDDTLPFGKKVFYKTNFGTYIELQDVVFDLKYKYGLF